MGAKAKGIPDVLLAVSVAVVSAALTECLRLSPLFEGGRRKHEILA